MSDAIFIKQARYRCHIGVTEQERSVPQDVLIDVELGMDLSTAGTTDSIESTIDYRRVWETVRERVEHSEHRLVEALANAVGCALLDRYAMVEWVSVRLTKPAAMASRGVGQVGVQLTVKRDDAGG